MNLDCLINPGTLIKLNLRDTEKFAVPRKKYHFECFITIQREVSVGGTRVALDISPRLEMKMLRSVGRNSFFGEFL